MLQLCCICSPNLCECWQFVAFRRFTENWAILRLAPILFLISFISRCGSKSTKRRLLSCLAFKLESRGKLHWEIQKWSMDGPARATRG